MTSLNLALRISLSDVLSKKTFEEVRHEALPPQKDL
jgi:hypothetical protein